MEKSKVLTYDELCDIVHRLVSEEIKLRDAFIQKNGYKDTVALDRFANRITAYSGLYGVFEEECGR